MKLLYCVDVCKVIVYASVCVKLLCVCVVTEAAGGGGGEGAGYRIKNKNPTQRCGGFGSGSTKQCLTRIQQVQHRPPGLPAVNFDASLAPVAVIGKNLLESHGRCQPQVVFGLAAAVGHFHVDWATLPHACHAKRRWMRVSATPVTLLFLLGCQLLPHDTGADKRRRSKDRGTNPDQARHPVPSVPRLPRKTTVDVTLCHACTSLCM